MKPLVHIVEDDLALALALQRLLRSADIATRLYATGEDFLRRDEADAPGCLLVDVRLPDMSGLDLVARLKQQNIALPVIVMTGYGDIPMSVRAMKAGAVDFLPKPVHDGQLLDAIATALAADASRREADARRGQIFARAKTLSPRETQVFHLVVSGKLNKTIAAELGLSEITVKVHRAAVMRKMAAGSLAELVRLAAQLQPPVAPAA